MSLFAIDAKNCNITRRNATTFTANFAKTNRLDVLEIQPRDIFRRRSLRGIYAEENGETNIGFLRGFTIRRDEYSDETAPITGAKQ